MQQGSSVEQELSRRIIWFIHLRWLAAGGVLTTVLVGHYVLHLAAPLRPLLSVAAFIVLYNVVCYLVAVRGGSATRLASQRLSTAFANVQISLDLISLTLLLHFSGGAENPFALYFIFHMIIASILLSRLAAFLQAALAVALYNSMVIAETSGVIPHVHLHNFLPLELNGTVYVSAVQVVFTTTIAISVYMATSITQRLRAHEKAVLSLSIQLAEEHGKLQDAYDMLEHTQKLQVQYMRKVSHELRSPLAAIDSMLTLVVGRIVREDEKRSELIERSLNRIKSLLRMVNDLLVLLRSKDAQPMDQFQPVDLQTIAEKVVDLLTSRAEQEKVALECKLESALSPVLGDPEAVEQLLTNLVSNGLKYTHEGGVVGIAITNEGNHVRIEVSDTGIGITEEDQSRVFGEFYRSKEAREFAPVGTGLGLSIVKSIVDNHKGKLHLKSAVGEGTTFTVFLPIALQSLDLPMEGSESNA